MPRTSTNIFTISYADSDSTRAYEVVQSLMTMFVQNNVGRNRADMKSAQNFLDRQIAEYEAKLDDAESTLATFKARYMDLLPGQRGLQDALGDVSGELAGLESRLQDAQTRDPSAGAGSLRPRRRWWPSRSALSGPGRRPAPRRS
ncbi:MAG: hypothetical protein U5L06_10670 [Rhodovibrio sp.]|nr:hypothetical protein [Rhodovibrio sp.]